MECKLSAVPTGHYICEVRDSGSHWMRGWVGFRTGVSLCRR